MLLSVNLQFIAQNIGMQSLVTHNTALYEVICASYKHIKTCRYRLHTCAYCSYK
jgi:hypothetical protein